MKLFLSFFISIGLHTAFAQSNIQYENLDFGNYSVGFTDSLIIQDEIPYQYKSYSGGTPILLKIWHPLKKKPNTAVLKFEDFHKSKNLDPKFAELESDLIEKFDAFYENNILRQDYIHFDEINYPLLGSAVLLSYIKNTKSLSHEAELKGNQNFPIIIYHHGSRGTAFDNHVMAEYLASHGYIVIAGNFNLPYENKPYGFTKNDPYDTRLSQSVIDFAQNLDGQSKIGFIGHSWGGQIGFSLLANQKKVSAFVSMETTLELWSRKQVKTKWPRLCSNIMDNYSNYNLPILMFANSGEETPISFDFFKPIQSPQLIFASFKKEFVHESYASYYSSRLIYRELFTQADAIEFKDQVKYYGDHLKLIRSFMNQNLKGFEPFYVNYEDLFYLKIKTKDSLPEDQKPAVVNSPN